VWLNALAMKVREAGRIQNTAVLVATGVNADEVREIQQPRALDPAGRRR
jgi:transposase-like protein